MRGLYYFSGIRGTQRPSSRKVISQAPTRCGGITRISGAQLGAGLEDVDAKAEAENTSLYDDPYLYSAYPDPGQCLSSAMNRVSESWANLLQACHDLIAFDMVLCPHDPADLIEPDPRPKMATVRLSGCGSCGSCPEGPAFPGKSPEYRLPLLSPPPLHTATVAAAQRLDNGNAPYPPFIVRCRACLKDRWCERCNIWWCESCYTVAKKRMHTSNTTPSGADPKTGATSHAVSGRETSLTPLVDQSIKVHNGLCTSKCLMDELLNGVGEGGMWG